MDMDGLEWVLYYEGNKRASSLDYAPRDVPMGIVQIILSRSERGWIKLDKDDFYVYVRDSDGSGEWFGISDPFALINRVVYASFPMECTRAGMTTRDSTWDAIRRRSMRELKALRKA